MFRLSTFHSGNQKQAILRWLLFNRWETVCCRLERTNSSFYTVENVNLKFEKCQYKAMANWIGKNLELFYVKWFFQIWKQSTETSSEKIWQVVLQENEYDKREKSILFLVFLAIKYWAKSFPGQDVFCFLLGTRKDQLTVVTFLKSFAEKFLSKLFTNPIV